MVDPHGDARFWRSVTPASTSVAEYTNFSEKSLTASSRRPPVSELGRILEGAQTVHGAKPAAGVLGTVVHRRPVRQRTRSEDEDTSDAALLSIVFGFRRT